MMDWMRKSAPLIIIVIVIAFGLTLVVGNGMNGKQSETVGVIAGQKISYFELRQSYERARENSRSQGIDMSEEQMRQLPMNVWEEIVFGRVMELVTEDMKLSATPQEVITSLRANPPAQLRQYPTFQNEQTGEFDLAKYQNFMSDPTTYSIPMIQYFEQMAYTQLPKLKVGELLQQGNVVSPSEVEAEYHRQNDLVTFEYLTCPRFLMSVAPEKINDAAIESYYTTNVVDFETAEQSELYFVALRKQATAFDELTIGKELIQCKTRILDNESSFEDEADIESDDERTRTAGGLIGWLTRTDFPAFAPVFDLEVGQYSEPIKSQLGIHIVRLDSTDGEGDSARIYVRHIMKNIEPTPVTLDSIDYLADDLVELAESVGLDSAAAKLGLKLDSTGLFGKGELAGGLGYFAGLGSFAFDSEEGLFELFSNESALYVVAVKNRLEKGTLPLDAVSSDIKRLLRDSLQTEAAEEYLTSVKLSITGSLKEFAETDSLLKGEVIDSAISRSAYITGVGSETAIASAAFATELNTISEPIREGDAGVYLVKPTTITLSDTVPEAQYETIEQAIIAERAQSLFMEWFTAYREEIGVTEQVRNYIY